MRRTEPVKQHLLEEQRAKLLDGARKAFARKGMAATMADIAEAARVSQGLAYRYFANKEDIFHALIDQVLLTPYIGWQHILEMEATPGERLALLVSELMKARREYPEIYQLIDQVKSSEVAPANLRKRMRQQGQAFRDMLTQLVIEGQKTSEVAADDPDQLVTMVIACLEGLTRLSLHHPRQLGESYPDTHILLRMLQVDHPKKSRGAS